MNVGISKLIDAIIQNWHRCLMPPYGDGEFTPEDGQTDCNRFVNAVAVTLGYKGLEGKRANEIFDFVSESPDWNKIGSENAVWLANKGFLVIAAWKNPDPEQSGHVAVVRPGEPCTSMKWGYRVPQVPMVANVGPAERCRMDRGANWAFGEEPTYFHLKSISNES